MSHPPISQGFITCIFSLKVNLGQLGIREWNTVALEGFHIHQCPGLFGMCSSFVLFLHSGKAAEKLLKDTPESQWSGGMKIYFYYRQQSFHCLYSFTVFVPSTPTVCKALTVLRAKLAGSSQCDKSGLSMLFLVTLGTRGSSCFHPALRLVREPQLPPSLGKSIDSTS